MIYRVNVVVNDCEKETLKVEAENVDEAIKLTIRTYNEYLDKGFIKSYTIKGVD